MMDEYIKREDVIKHLRGACIAKYPLSFSYGIFASADEISKLPTADVVDVVRCKDCAHYIEMQGFEYKGKKPKHCIWHGALRSENYYCGDGIRRSESNGSKQ